MEPQIQVQFLKYIESSGLKLRPSSGLILINF